MKNTLNWNIWLAADGRSKSVLQQAAAEQEVDGGHGNKQLTTYTNQSSPTKSRRIIRPGTCPPRVRSHTAPGTVTPGPGGGTAQEGGAQRGKTAGSTQRSQTATGVHRETRDKSALSAHARLMAMNLGHSRSHTRSEIRDTSAPYEGRVVLTQGGYKVNTSPVLASGSQRTIQLITSVRSPQHEHRMKVIRMK